MLADKSQIPPERLSEFRSGIAREYANSSTIEQLATVIKNYDPLHHLQTIQVDVPVKLDDLANPSVHWEMCYGNIARSLCDAEETKLFESLKAVGESGAMHASDEKFGELARAVTELQKTEFHPNAILVPRDIDASFLATHPLDEASTVQMARGPLGTRLAIGWIKMESSPRHVIVYDTNAVLWEVEMHSETNRVAVDIVEDKSSLGSGSIQATSFVNVNVQKPTGVRCIRVNGEPLDATRYTRQ